MTGHSFYRGIVAAAVAAFGTMLGAPPALSQAQWPTSRITLVVPFTPGGSTDILARLISQKLEAALGQTVVVENRAGAGGSTASAEVARSNPDGYTIAMGHIGTLSVNPNLYTKLGYDPLKSFEPVTMIARVHNVLVVNPELPVKSTKELIDYAKANPGKLNYASGGNGSGAHITTLAFNDAAGIEMTHVPYRGTAPALQDLVAGQVQVAITGAPAVLELARSGRLRAIAVTGDRRIAAAPELPTMSESGLPGFDVSQWYGIVVPAGTPRPIVDRLNREIRAALAPPEVAARLAGEGADTWLMSPEEFRAHIAKETARWGDLIKRTKVPLIGAPS